MGNFDFELGKLLENHPDNRMAFEYYMTSLLLEKNLAAFTSNINRLKNYGYKEIPVLYEEALLLCISNKKKIIIPEGYSIRESTVKLFTDYSKINSSLHGNPVQTLSKLYGKTYWFYWQFN